jgi:hypothetical protein
MAQAISHEQAEGEVLLAGVIRKERFAPFLRSWRMPGEDTSIAPPFMLVESQPRQVVAPEKRQDLLQLTLFDPTFDFAPYTAGRIFHALGELRWEQRQADIQIVYTGHRDYQPDLEHAQIAGLDAFQVRERAYFLFGKRLDEKQRERIGSTAQPGDFAEVRIPRLLRYPALPTLTGAERIQLVVYEYEDTLSALNVAYRFKSLVRFQKQTERGQEGNNQ